MHALSVSEFLHVVNETLALIPPDVIVEGEVSDYRVSQGKWVSFDLKDEEKEAVLKCFTTVWKVGNPMEDGLRVRVTGAARVYERFGTMKLNVESIELVGEGALRRAYELLKKKLEEEGLFDPARKRVPPRFPERVGLITSREAAAYTDFLRIANNRWSGVHILFRHVHVQGKEAVSDILDAFEALAALDAHTRPDVIVLTRGGGGLEDLHAFNDEAVARAVFGSKIPVVVGVGHERDESLCDFVADVRASTPSNAAERVFQNRESVEQEIDSHSFYLETRMDTIFDQYRSRLRHFQTTTAGFFERLRERVRSAGDGLVLRLSERVSRVRERAISLEHLLKQLDPKTVLARGFGIVRIGSTVMKDTASLEEGSEVHVQLAHGNFDARVTDTHAS